MRLRQLTNLIGIPLIIIFIIGAVIEVSPEREEVRTRQEELPPLASETAYGVSAANPYAVEVGMQIMEQGGNAIDAAIAVSFMLGVVEPYGSGIGGGGSMLIYDPNMETENKVQYIDYRETAPLELVTTSMLEEQRRIQAAEAETEPLNLEEEEEPTTDVPVPTTPETEEMEEEADQAADQEEDPLVGSEDEEPETTTNESHEKEDETLPPISEQDINREEMRDFGVPGFLKGMAHLHEKYGTIPMENLIQPSIDRAREGFEVDAYLADRFFYAQNRIYHASIPHFFPENDFIREGQTLVQTELAETMEEIRDLGPEAYFHEVLAPEMARKYPLITENDFQEYTIWEEGEIPTGTYMGYTVYAAPPPLGGPVLVQALQMAEEMGLDSYNFSPPNGEEGPFANWDETTLLQYIDFMENMIGINDRTYRRRLSDIGDPNTSELARRKMGEIYERDYVRNMIAEWERELEIIQDDLLPGSEDNMELEEGTETFLPSEKTDWRSRKLVEKIKPIRKKYVHQQDEPSQSIKEETDGMMATAFFGENEYKASPFFDAQSELNHHNNTTHFVIVDKDGRMVSATHTLSNFFGSGEYYKGFFLNDQLSNFSQTPGSINEPKPGRRPRSFMTPAILIEEIEGHVNEVIGIGSPGGARIPMMMAHTLVYYGLQGMDFDDAVEMLRFQYDYNEGLQQFEVRLESAYQQSELYPILREHLLNRGFRTTIENGNMYFGGIQALIHNVREGVIDGNADPRRGGKWDRAEYDEG
ncbi:gamma-glutamyltranspeptidase/glutathione hydrolase [Evansella vedderi]|uniref:Gamma-glutamyltranspeptidase/glutathione hydrolase n=1 Tax=Evansella vedderi TaxID=38282 RepID=A0ABU0A173_9BACI|nr:gamma-glutamyltransferase [Evansella vedderi]MDQ0257233.1 gamma-glutamyltranspeptidase/glutathione hydrolase [Evansella vedderi]